MFTFGGIGKMEWNLLGLDYGVRGRNLSVSFSAPFGESKVTDKNRQGAIVFDFSGELSATASIVAMVYTGFTRQGSEVQILSRLPVILIG